MFDVRGSHNTAHVFATTVDKTTVSQLIQLCNQPWTEGSHIAIMPDCHAGAGCTVGSTMTVGDKVCPNLVGTDIGCGMLTVELPQELGDFSLENLDGFINAEIPAGARVNDKPLYNPRNEQLDLRDLRCFDALSSLEVLERSVGSLGGGNHFIEVDRASNGTLYLVIHTGSRGLGKQVAEHYQEMAERDVVAQGLSAPRGLAWLEGTHREDYLHDMYFCQHYARVSRELIARRIMEHLVHERLGNNLGAASVSVERGTATYQAGKGDHVSADCFETVHNYISPADQVLRKGAISAHEGERVLIPINMRDGAIIGRGKGNPAYNCSGPHGAGRLLSRSAAKQSVSLDEYRASMAGIYSTSVRASTLDESPMAYKPIDEILENIADTVEVDRIIKPIYNFKAH